MLVTYEKCFVNLMNSTIISIFYPQQLLCIFEIIPPSPYGSKLFEFKSRHLFYVLFQIIHWNSPKKYNVDNRDGEYFRNVATGFMEYNGNLLRKKLQYCEGPIVSSVVSIINAILLYLFWHNLNLEIFFRMSRLKCVQNFINSRTCTGEHFCFSWISNTRMLKTMSLLSRNSLMTDYRQLKNLLNLGQVKFTENCYIS